MLPFNSLTYDRVSGLYLMRGASYIVVLHSALSRRADSIALSHSIFSSLTFPTFELSLKVALSLNVACGRSCIVVLYSTLCSRAGSIALVYSVLSSAFV